MPAASRLFHFNALRPIWPVALVALVALSYGFAPMGDENDVWWHLKTGKLIAANHGLPPKYDVLSYTSAHAEWHNHEWLSQWAMYEVFSFFEGRQLGGFRSVILLKSLILAAAFALVWLLGARRSGDAGVSAIMSLIAVSASMFSLAARPPIITYFFTPLFLIILYGAHPQERRFVARSDSSHPSAPARPAWGWMLALPLLMILWANLHGGFVIGLILIVFFMLGSLAEGWLAWSAQTPRGRLMRTDEFRLAGRFAICAGCCFAATLINPAGWKIYEMYLRVMGDKELVAAISEMQPPNLAFTQGFTLMIVALVAFGSLAGRRLPRVADYLILLFFLQQALSHVRHLPLFAVTVAPLLAWQAAQLKEGLWPQWKRCWPTAIAALAAAVAIGSVMLPRMGWLDPTLKRNASSWDRNRLLLQGLAYVPEGFPEEVCNFLLSQAPPLPGRLFNEVQFAGYLIWRLSPEKYQLFTDNRFDIFGGQYQRLAWQIENGAVRDGRRIWSELLDEWGVNLVIIDSYKPLNKTLQESGEWKLAFVDSRGLFRLWARLQPIPVREHK
ncbi:MAG: hypothetical protein NTX50_15965 [Candidatus Sumerlaeota bacterium]|nr:hypothetical protein [Candidatus Sumerlaeota bacterium]